MQNINPYDESKFKNKFCRTEIYNQLVYNYGEDGLVWTKNFYLDDRIKTTNSYHQGATPRSRYPLFFSASVFYYLLPLLEINYDTIYDLGCGSNMFKPYIPRLKGIAAEWSHWDKIKDPSWPDVKSRQDFDSLPYRIKHECMNVYKISIDDIFHGDIKDCFDDNFVVKYRDYYQAIFSICALHFHPLRLLKKIVTDFSSIIKVGGRGFLALNLQRMIERESLQFLLEEFATSTPTKLQYEQYVRNELYTLDLKFLILDVDLDLMDDSMDGNIRLVFEK